MDTRLLRSFLAVARFASFTDAGLELGFTQSTVTSHVQKLESQLGVPVLNRLPGGVQLTEQGHRLVIRAEELLAAEDRLYADVEPGADRPRGTVRIIAPESLCTYRLPGMISSLSDAEPGIQIWLSPGGLNSCIDAVTRGAVDVALTLEPHLPASDLTALRIGKEPLILITKQSAESGAAAQPLCWADLARQDVLLIEEGCGYSDQVATHLGATDENLGRRAHFGSIEAIKRCVAVGLGWAAVPAVTVEEEITTGTLSRLTGPPLPDCDVHMLTHPRRHHGPAVETVQQELQKVWKVRSS